MYHRELYLRQIRPFYRNEQIKILTGVRRAGKTELLKMIQNELLVESDKGHILYLSFELLENNRYRDALALYDYLQSQIADKGMYYIFLDEIQFVKGWPEGSIEIVNAHFVNLNTREVKNVRLIMQI